MVEPPPPAVGRNLHNGGPSVHCGAGRGRAYSPGHFPSLILGIGGFCTVFLAVTWRRCRGGAHGEWLALPFVVGGLHRGGSRRRV